jgi:ABC-type dipeptide/oligopeptide/nickel transport system permease component
MAAIMMLAFLTVIGNLFADVMYGVMDPRVRLE